MKFTYRHLLLILIISGLLSGLAYRYYPYGLTQTAKSCPNFQQGEIILGDQTMSIGLALTPSEQAKGLGGCAHLPPDHGLYFPVDPPRASAVWMKDMLIPIDVVWINQARVISLEKNIAPPLTGQSLAELPVFPSPDAVTAFLELPAGEIDRLHLTVGTAVSTASFDNPI